MNLFNDKWEITISEIQYDPESADNIISPDSLIVICNDYSKSLLLSVKDLIRTIEKNIVLTVSFYTPNSDFAFIDGDSLFLFLNDAAIIYNLKTGEVEKRVNLHLTGTLFSVYTYLDDFILYCETDIIRMNRNLDLLWDFSARDIFVRYHGDEPAFEMYPDRIRLYDFSDCSYEIDYDGKILKNK